MLKPVNRHILINKQEKTKERKSELFLPEDYAPKEEVHSSYEVLDWSEDIRFELKKGGFVVVDNKMIEKISINNVDYFIVQDNYVVGIFNKTLG